MCTSEYNVAQKYPRNGRRRDTFAGYPPVAVDAKTIPGPQNNHLSDRATLDRNHQQGELNVHQRKALAQREAQIKR